MKQKFSVVALLAVLAALMAFGGGARPSTAAQATAAATMAGTMSAAAATDDILTVAGKAGNFKTLATLVKAAGLEETLKGKGPFTVFAPTDEAFAKLPKAVVDYLTAPANKELLAEILTYHVVAGDVKAEKVVTMKDAETVQGDKVAITVDGKNVKVNSANVVTTDVAASNGVIHVIDGVILPQIELPKVDAASVKGNIITAGSSTVFPLTRRLADQFRKSGFTDNIEVASIGTGAGFERFCKAGETDISNASAKIKSSDLENCAKLSPKREPLEFFVGIDALAVVVNKETAQYVKNLTTAQIADIFSGKFKTWKDFNSAYPADPIKLYSPGTDSGTFEYFVEAIYKKDKKPILDAKPELSEDDNVLVNGVAGTKGAIGYFGFAYYLPNTDKLVALNVNDVVANQENAEAGKYPLARPLFIYSDANIIKNKPQVAAFINYYLTNVDGQLGTGETATGEKRIAYFPVNVDARSLRNLLLLAATAK